MHRPSHDYINKLYIAHEPMFDFMRSNRAKLGNVLLNVGLSRSAVNAGEGWIDYFTKDMETPFEKVIVLELNKDNIEYFRNKFKDNPSVDIVHGDVRTASKHITKTDSVFWFHGPEHIKREELQVAFKELESITSKFMLWVCPWGNYYKLNIGEYEEDNHWYYPENEDFTKLGLTVFNEGGDKNSGHANINAYLFKYD